MAGQFQPHRIEPAALSREARQRLVAQRAREGLARVEAINAAVLGRVPDETITVDGKAGAAFESIDPDHGEIDVRFQAAGEMLAWITEQLAEHSPVRSGRYRGSHLFFADGAPADPASAPVGSVYIFANPQPYARPIEGGLSSQAPDGVYQAVAVLAQRRFGNLARVDFEYRAVEGGALVSTAAVSTLRRKVGRREASRMVKQERDQRRPAIVVRMD